MNSFYSSDKLGFEFRGKASEWFGIWIVNLLLSIVTLGIYSAWAKVRAKKYFYQNTYVAGRNFDYHATGAQILIGRAIVIVGFLFYSVASTIPLLGLIALVGLIAAFPYLITRALMFNARMSSWSNVRFNFDGTTGRAALVYLLYPVLTALTLYTTFPFLDRAMKRYSIDHHTLGEHRFKMNAPIGPFYTGMIAAIAWALGISVVIYTVVAMQLGGPKLPALEHDPSASFVLAAGIYAAVFLAFFPAATIFKAFVRNAVYNSTELDGGHRFISDIQPITMVWIAMTNAVAVIGTLGLMLPWAHVRMARYQAEHTTLVAGDSLDTFVGQMEERSTAIGDAYSDIEGIELGLPI